MQLEKKLKLAGAQLYKRPTSSRCGNIWICYEIIGWVSVFNETSLRSYVGKYDLGLTNGNVAM